MGYLVASVVALFFIAFLIPVTPASAADTVPTKMNFQGRLTDTAGNLKANGTYNMRFKLYTVSSGGANVWSEDRLVSASQGVAVTNGSFSVQLGSVTTLPANLFASGTLYLEVELPTPASATTASPVWTEGAMTPRNQMLTSAYAYNAETVDGIDGSALAQLSANNTFTGTNSLQATSATAFRVQSAAAANTFLTVDTSGGQVSIGNAASDGTAVTFRLDDKNTAGDPAGVAGAMYYNSSLGKFRCYQGVAWTDCIGAGGGGSGTLQDAYNNSASPALITTTASKGINVTAGAAPTADMVAISNAGFGVTTDSVNGLSINYVGGSGVVESSGARIDLTPGTTSGSTWNGLKIVANPTGAVAGVNQYGINLDGPTSPGAGIEAAINIDANWDAGIQLGTKSAEPQTPDAGNIFVYGGRYANRSMLSQKGPSGVVFAYQPAFFQNTITMYSPNTTTTGNYIGGAWTIDTTASTATTSTETLGFGTNFATAATANDTAGTYQTAAQFMRGSVAGGANGFFYVSRIVLPDVGGYGAGATGSRIWTGMTSAATSTLMVGSDNPAGHYAGFQYSTARGDTGWRFLTKDGTTQAAPINTNMAATANKVYDMYIYVPPLGTTMYWRIDNLNDGTTQEGSTTANLPGTTTNLRGSAGIATLTTTARNIRVNKIYIESDR